jgi:hypothetical protein
MMLVCCDCGNELTPDQLVEGYAGCGNAKSAVS